MNKIKKLLLYAMNIPLYWISKLIPKNKNIWIFGAWFGDKYADNSKYLFEYVNKNHPEIRAIWLTKADDTLGLLHSKGYETYKSTSFKGYYFSMRAYFGFVSTGFNDINHFVFTEKYINLWHGNPLKKVVYDDKLTNGVNYDSLFNRLIRIIFPFIHLPEDYDYILASSEEESKNLSTAFNKKTNDILITGLPRNDVFSCDFNGQIKKIIYMPTHRNEGEMDIKKVLLKNLDELNKILSTVDIELYIKLHYYHMKDMNLEQYSNIFLLHDDDIEQDIYSVINKYDLLITDYSSIFFDFLLTHKPIIFAPFDYNEYLTKDRELYYDYDDVTPGPKCKNWNEVLEWIEKFKENPNLYSEERKKIKDKFHKYQDGKSCERVYQEIKRLLNE